MYTLLMKMNSSPLTWKVSEYDFRNIRHQKWFGIVCDISEKLYLDEVIVKGNIFDLKLIKDLMHEEWCDKIPIVPKLRYYVKLKHDVNTASHLKRQLTGFNYHFFLSYVLGFRLLLLKWTIFQDSF